MPEFYEFTRVRSFREEPAIHHLTFQTEAGRQCWLRDGDPAQLGLETTREAAAQDQVVFVAFDSTNGRCNYVTYFSRDHVKAIYPAPEDRPGLKVRLRMNPTFHLLLQDHPRFAELAELLKTSMNEGKLLWIGTFPGDKVIKDIQLPKP